MSIGAGYMMTVNKKRKNRICVVLRNNKGTTMMETLVAFTVLMIILVALTKIVFFSSELRMRAIDTGRLMQTFNKELYSNGELDKVSEKKYVTEYVDYEDTKKGPVFYIVPDQTSVEGEVDLWVSDIHAYSYAYDVTKDSNASTENLVIPKAIKFVHEKDDKTAP